MAQLNKAKYLKRLELESANNAQILTKQKNYYDDVANNMVPPVAQYSTIAEELGDRVLQREKAFNNLKKITGTREAGVIVNNLQNEGEIDDFNRFFTPFASELKGQSGLSPTTFDLVWARYKDKLRLAAPEGIAFEDPVEEEKKQKKLIADITSSTSKALLDVVAATDASKSYDNIVSLSSAEIKDILDTLLTMDEEKDREIVLTTSLKPPITKVVKLKEKTNKAGKEYYTVPNKRAQVREIIFRVKGVLLAPGGKVGFGVMGNKAYSKVSNKAHSKVSRGRGIGGNVSPTSVQDPELGTLVVREELKVAPETRFPRKPRQSKRYSNYAKFGQFMLHLPSLERGYINLKYDSYATIKNFPKRAVSSPVRKLIRHILRDEQFPAAAYADLTAKDKVQFDEIVSFARLPEDKAHDFLKYNSSKALERDRDLQRFELLKGEIGAGNNNPVHICELKLLVLKMAKDGAISAADRNEVLYSLALI